MGEKTQSVSDEINAAILDIPIDALHQTKAFAANHSLLV